jgi:hypothetical protein
MTVDAHFTRRPFTVAICTACDTGVAHHLLPRLREVVRNCPHGMLVSTQCLLGALTCATRPERGMMMLLQACNPERVPTAAIQWIGPVSTPADADAACAWISAGLWDRADLPPGLRAEQSLARASARN